MKKFIIFYWIFSFLFVTSFLVRDGRMNEYYEESPIKANVLVASLSPVLFPFYLGELAGKINYNLNNQKS